MRISIKGGKLLLPDGDGFRVQPGDISIKDHWIEKLQITDADAAFQAAGRITPDSENHTAAKYVQDASDKVIDASGKLVMPGLINAHTHAYMSLFRNYADDLEFFDWLHKVEVVEDEMSGEDCYWTTLLSIAEMYRTGTTCFVDMCMRSSKDGAKSGPAGAVSGAVNDSGIRAWLSRGLVGEADDPGSLRRLHEFLEDAHLNEESDRVNFLLGPHAPYSCGQSILQLIRDTGIREGMPATIHISESEAEMEGIAQNYGGMTPVQYVEKSGLFELPTIAAHLVNATDEDIGILKKHGVSVAINPRSNMKLGNGFAPVRKFLESGLNICLGTDGSGSNNTQNMFREMHTAALVYKGSEKKAKCVDAADVVRFATAGGARALGMEGKLGVIREGALADLILLDLNLPQFIPQNDLISALAYSANGSEVRTVLVDGQVVMEDGHILTFDEQEVFAKCQEIADRLRMSDKSI